ncbi:uncharacterized protein LOC113214581 isoform X2 [Frankliniella occidentalis]|uniref:Uncharacterized protein LOC113214581 isoform X2 n=1 Tax=Frankliniella occidentalis TaxID=133901 RepID=A0A6J1TG70_FRAOC|nr:uncharacterized protein LOC113214581 isoform X2 [Frankliniella occidentalis]
MPNSASNNNEDMHIITASNVHKKLFFQGWKKSVEVFSQGKGSLSHRCSSILSQLDSSHLDEAISWSSSEGEEDKSNSQLVRPTRTLASHINFSDCKRVQRRGRRHSSAQFVRSVEKRLKTEQNKSHAVSGHKIEESIIIPDSSHSVEHPINASESFDEPNWVNNLSILNKRINLSLNAASLLSSEQSIGSTQISPTDRGSQENNVRSPILVSGKAKNFKRKRNRNSKQIISLNEGDSSMQSSTGLLPGSPVFKITSRRRRSSRKTPQQSSVILEKKSDESICPNKNASCIGSKNSTVMAQMGSEIFLGTPSSPVIGKSSTKRRKAMVVDKLLSPILGSKPKSSRPYKIQKIISNSKLSCTVNSNTSLPYERPNASSNSDVNFEITSSVSTENLATAKRSLDFSVGNQNIGCNTSIIKDIAEEKSQIECKKTSSDHVSDNSDKFFSQKAGLSQADSPGFGCSQLIEEINTEQIDIDNVSKSVETPVQLQKKKKLSLSKKQVSKQSISSKCSKIIKPEEIEVKGKSYQTGHDFYSNLKQFDVFEDMCNQAPKKEEILGNRQFQPATMSTNCTLLIEEENSEPMESASLDAFSSPGYFFNEKRDSPTNLSSSSTKESETKSEDVEDANIDSYASQSPGNSQLTQFWLQIEKLPSSCVSSPMTISQTSSSPMAPVVVSGLSAETVPDDYNAPPKKGKKKLKPDGLASRLQRLLNRHRSSSRIWQFKRTKESKASYTPTVNNTRNTSMVLTVHHTWIEYSHVIIQGFVESDMSSGTVINRLNSLSDHVVLVLDPQVADKLGKIMSAKKIRVFPPWQALKLQGISLILCAYCIEVIQAEFLEFMGSLPIPEKTTTVPIKDGYECFLGASLSDIIFPKIVERPTCIFQCTTANQSDEYDFNKGFEGPANLCTISSLVSNYVGATCDTLNLTILRTFQFRQAVSDKVSSNYPCWSLLGQDVVGEVCEVLLGSEQMNTVTSGSDSIWSLVKTGLAIGQVFSFVGFFPAQRISPFRVSNLWRVVSNICAKPCDQPVFYVLAASSAEWEIKAVESEKMFDKIQLNLTPLTKILIKDPISSPEPTRVNIVCRRLHTTYERLYVTDTETSPCITVISVNPTTFLSPVIFKSPVLIILDLEIDPTGDLRVDKYSRISSLGGDDLSFIEDFHNTKFNNSLANLSPTLPNLQKDSSPRSLAVFSGTIIGVDEDSAFMWPACGICENELLSLGDNSEKYRCEKCNDQCDNFTLRMSLQVLCSCPNLPSNSSVRLKLLQKTIEALLPPALAGEEGYDMNTVLGQKLGPLKCEITNVNDQNFTLQEFL